MEADFSKKMIETRDRNTDVIDRYKLELEKTTEKMVKQSKMSTIGEVTATLSHEINEQIFGTQTLFITIMMCSSIVS